MKKNAVIIEWLVSLFGLFLLVLVYTFIIPISNILIKTFVENGAPLAQMMFIRTCAIWGFAVLGVLCLMYPFIAGYRKIYDQGQYGYSGWGR